MKKSEEGTRKSEEGTRKSEEKGQGKVKRRDKEK